MERTTPLPHLEHTHLWTAGSSSSRCTQCNPQRNKKARNLIVCIDGVHNGSGPNRTNVQKLFEQIEKQPTHLEQHALYFGGIGTDEKLYLSPHGIQRSIDLSGTNLSDKLPYRTANHNQLDIIFASNVDKAVKEAYHWLAVQYQEGDQIYLFGFSRGAYQVRMLAEMVHEVGLIKETVTKDQVERAYDCYEASHQGKPMAKQAAKDFRDVFSLRDVRVHFIGVWETLIGFGKRDVFPSVTSSIGHTCCFRHALALDERRVKFVPEYFCETNSRTGDGKSVHVDQARSTEGDGSTDLLEKSDIKEVWFAGSHSDVGGRSIPGGFHHAGHVSLLWMRREAVASGLVLGPTDLVWLPEDIDVGISDPLSPLWQALEYLPVKHQSSFSGTGKHAFQPHRLQPRRVMPGQKVHASVLYANTYQPRATLGAGFDIPVMHPPSDEGYATLNTGFWETGLFDGTAAQELVTFLCSQRDAVPIYQDRLLFMVRFGEGKRYVREVSGCKDRLMEVIQSHNHDHPTLVRLIAIVVYHAAFYDLDGHLEGCAELSPAIFPNAEECMRAILDAHQNGNDRTVVAVLRLLTKHQILRQHILLPIVQTLVELLDSTIRKPTDDFIQAMGGLVSLLECFTTRQSAIEKLGASSPDSGKSRLSLILEVQDTNHLTAALRMTLALARISEAGTMCTALKPEIRALASKQEGRVGQLAIEILLVLYDPNDHNQLDIHDTRVRANLASAFVRLYLEGHYLAADNGEDPRQRILRRLFGHHTTQLSKSQSNFIEELRKAIEEGNDRERIAATITLLDLCETPIIRTKLRDIKLLDTFINQLRRKDKALLAAYALVTCSRYSDLKESIKNDGDWPKYIISMLERDYFDDAMGTIEGFRVFADFMQDAELRERIIKCDIIYVLWTKLGRGGRENQTGLIYLDIVLACDLNLSWADKLTDVGLEYLRSAKTREAGAMILSALAQSKHGTMVVRLE